MTQSSSPLVSVVTVVYNGVDVVEETIQSVIQQTYKPIEYIIVDGGSSDGTLDAIIKYKDSIDCLISERDKGIYDAMNKGIAAANGEWVIFMNAGDLLYDNNVLIDTFGTSSYDQFDFIYGNHVTQYPDYHFDNVRLPPLKGMWKKLPFSHQSLFTRTELLKRRNFDTSFKIVADQDMIYESYLKGAKFLYVDQFVSISTVGGVSDLKRVESYRERKKFISKYSGTHFKVLYFQLILIIEKFKFGVKSLLGPNILNILIKNRNQIFRNVKILT